MTTENVKEDLTAGNLFRKLQKLMQKKTFITTSGYQDIGFNMGNMEFVLTEQNEAWVRGKYNKKGSMSAYINALIEKERIAEGKQKC